MFNIQLKTMLVIYTQVVSNFPSGQLIMQLNFDRTKIGKAVFNIDSTKTTIWTRLSIF